MFTVRAYLWDSENETYYPKTLYNPVMTTSDTDKPPAITEGNISMELGKAGSAELTLPKSNPCYDNIQKMRTMIQIMNGNEEVFFGRVLHDETDFYGNKKLYLEGVLAFLIDRIIVPPVGYTFNDTAYKYLGDCINEYNNQSNGVNPLAMFWLTEEGDTTPLCHWSSILASTTLTFEEHEYVTVQDAIYNKIVEKCGGYIRARLLDWNGTINGVGGFPRHTIDYLVEEDVDYIGADPGYFHVCGQTVEFGENLKDLVSNVTAEDTFTVLVPLGKMQEVEVEYDDSTGHHKKTVNTERINIKGVARNPNIDPDDQGQLYVRDPQAQSAFGNIWKTIVWDDVTDANTLYGLAHQYLGQYNHITTTLTVNAVDLGLIDHRIDNFRIGDYVKISSWPHKYPKKDELGNAILLQCKKIDIDLINPGNSEYTFESMKKSITEMQSSTASNVDSVKATLQTGGGGGSGLNALEERVASVESSVSTIEMQVTDIALNSTEIRDTTGVTVMSIFRDSSNMRTCWYYIEGANVTELPSSDTDNGTLEIRKLGSSDWGSMTFYSNSGKVWINSVSNGTLGAWKEI